MNRRRGVGRQAGGPDSSTRGYHAAVSLNGARGMGTAGDGCRLPAVAARLLSPRFAVAYQLLPDHPTPPSPEHTSRTKEVYVNNQRVVIRYNDTCHFYQPPRAHHCSVNDNCIERFDHHCPWVGTTIGLVRPWQQRQRERREGGGLRAKRRGRVGAPSPVTLQFGRANGTIGWTDMAASCQVSRAGGLAC